jgi:hypothetical protein
LKEQLFKHEEGREGEEGGRDEAKRTYLYNIECSPKSVIKLKQCCGSGSDFPFWCRSGSRDPSPSSLHILTKKYTFIHSFSKLHWFKHEEGREGDRLEAKRTYTR